MSRKKNWIAKPFGALVVVLSFCSFSYSNAQTAGTESTTPNLITSGTGHTWTGVSTGAVPTGCATAGPCPGGPGALYDPSTNTIHFSYGQSTAAQTFAINQALQNAGTGIQVQGYNYSWQINNLNGDNRQSSTDTLTARVITHSSNGTVLRNDSWTYNTKFDWTTFSGSVNYTTPAAPSTFGNLRVEFTGADSGFWGGYFGPQVRNVGVSLRYSADPCTVDPQSSPSCPGYKTYYTLGDDSYTIVPLPFGYPLYGRTFTHSIMFDNGVVSFYDPIANDRRLGGTQYWAEPLSNNLGSQFYYSIMPLWTDLAPGSGTKLYSQTDSTNYFKYTWEDLPQYGYANRLNTFSLEIRPTGYLGIQYDKINIGGYPITAGVVGNAALGEWHQHFRSEGTQISTGGIGSWNLPGTVATDCSNALTNPACPGYAEAYFNQQCTINSLYNPSCPGYAAAYFTQQCTINPLYDINCPGYATAYYNYQCSVNPLYHTGCPGYEQAYFNQQCTANPLYNSGCPGYDTAYFNQQCGLNPLYNTQCSGYADAYYVQQCTANPLYDVGCTGYQQAYYTQQCTINPLYDTGCPGYQQAFFNQQCTANPLYNNQCPGYATAFFNQQCSANALYDKTCPGYAEAYALKYIVANPSTPSSTPTASTPTTTIVLASNTTADPVAQAAPLVADPVVNNVVTTRSTATTSAASPASPVQLTAPAPAPAAVAASAKEEKKEEKKTESTSSSSTSSTASTSTDNKDQPKSNRQALAERRLEAARSKAIEEGKQLANKMGEAATMEAQVAVQNVVVQAMGFTPGFDAYGKVSLPDVQGYKPFEIYRGQRNIDNPAGRRFMTGSDRLHSEMVDSQYNLGK